jgi:hypothetical protein
MSKKIVIPKEQLPNLIAGETDCFIRFRIRTADFGRFSAWTPIFSVTPTVAYTNGIATLQADVAALEGDVTNLYNVTDDNFIMSVVV